MRVNKIRLRSEKLGEIFTLSLFTTAIPQPYEIKAATGLDADSIHPVTYGSDVSGDRFYTMSLDSRDIVMRIGLNPDVGNSETFSDLRSKVQRAIAASRNPLVTIDLLMDSTVVASINGHISSFVASLFVALPEIQLKVTCDTDPLFIGPLVTLSDLSEVNTTGTLELDYAVGTAPTGINTVVNITNPMSSFGFAGTDGEWLFNVIYTFLTNDTLIINTEPGNLEVSVVRYNPTITAYETINLGDRVESSSLWPILFPGLNTYLIAASVGLYEIESFSYYPRYWGV